MVSRALKLAVSKEARHEYIRNKKLVEELLNNDPKDRYEIIVGKNYSVSIIEPTVGLRSVQRSAIEYIIEKNTQTVEYTTKEDEDDLLAIPKRIKYVPKRSHINIRNITLVYVPRWDIYFDVYGKTYTKGCL